MSEDYGDDNTTKRNKKANGKRKAIMNMALPESDHENDNDVLDF